MTEVTTIGLDLAKSVFQVHGVDRAGKVVIRRQLKRSQVLAFLRKLPPCLVGMEACASYVRKLVTELSGGVFGYLDSVLERHSFDEFGELI